MAFSILVLNSSSNLVIHVYIVYNYVHICVLDLIVLCFEVWL